ncbi:type II secretion system protein GspM [Thalassotalea maritima]|uniref:type II secretion system protein GspM n=1 Tax=Thalassotalea maritima TaxID=3242416 RepID=UPI0035291E59
MKQWWLGLNQREQRLAIIMASVVVIFVFFTAVWQPLNQSITKAEQKLARQQQLAIWVDEHLFKLKALEQTTGKRVSSASLSTVVNRTARRQNIDIARMQPQGEDLQVWIDEVPFNTFITWLDTLANKEGLKVMSLDVSESNTSGSIAVRRLQLSKAG